MSRSLQSRAAALALKQAQILSDDLDRRREEWETQVDAWNDWMDEEGHDGTEEDAPDEPEETPPLPDRQLLYAIQVAAGAARQQNPPGRPKAAHRKPPQPRNPKR
jgi:hypothetical protein